MSYLQEFSGEWTVKEVRHLLRRTIFGPNEEMTQTSLRLGLTGTINKLFEDIPNPSPPVKSIQDGTASDQLIDPGINYGETWIHADPFPDVEPNFYRNRILRSRSKSLYSWIILQMHYSGLSIKEKMILFWHNHFVIGDVVNGHREYNYYSILRKHALGNFRSLTEDITTDVGMLVYLSGAENTNDAPNENYSRELLELFTIGKGALAGPGDYTNYTEEDVEVMAKVLTGWRIPHPSEPATSTSFFDPRKHTEGDKVVSERFGEAIILENGEDEYKDLIALIFQQKEVARFITRKLYRWFVNYEITDEIEENIIEPLATILKENDYEIEEPLKVLLKSEHFFQSTACMVKSPVDLIMSASRGLGVEPPQGEVEPEYDHAYHHYIMSADMEQHILFHPNVAGWKAYYQEPQFYKLWINNLLLPKRQEFCRLMVEGGRFSYNDEPYRIDIENTVPVLDLIVSIEENSNPNKLIEGLAKMIFNYPVSDLQIKSLKDILIPGLPDFEWTIEYGRYLSNPSDENQKIAVENMLRRLLSQMVRMSEFQIM